MVQRYLNSARVIEIKPRFCCRPEAARGQRAGLAQLPRRLWVPVALQHNGKRRAAVNWVTPRLIMQQLSLLGRAPRREELPARAPESAWESPPCSNASGTLFLSLQFKEILGKAARASLDLQSARFHSAPAWQNWAGSSLVQFLFWLKPVEMSCLNNLDQQTLMLLIVTCVLNWFS